MSKVFISYSHKDKTWVKDYLLPNLEKQGISCHIDYRDFEIGPPSLIQMEQAAETCSKIILVFTPNWVDSEFSNFESVMLQTDSPLNLNKKILPIMLETCNIPKRLKILNYADFTAKNDWDFALAKLVNQIKKDLAITAPEKIIYPELIAQNIDISRLPQTGFELFGRQNELTLLNEAWESGQINVLSFVAYGGVGKSTLINKWLEKLRWDNYRGAEKVFAWSFYSQGTNEYVTSADLFIHEALTWFGDPNPGQGSAWDKGKRLARLIGATKTLLILDGLEPLQSGLDFEKGKIKDPALSMLITGLTKSNQGLCLITTRERIPELDRYPNTAKQENLEHISDEAGRKLLELRGIQGTEAELTRAVNEFGNHALAINLLAEYLHQIPGHPVSKAFEIPDLDIPVLKGKHPRRIIDAFARQFGKSSPEFELLSILGLFDRPVAKETIDAIINDTPIHSLTQNLSNIKPDTWIDLLTRLRKYKLLIKQSEHRPRTLDCHPLIREHFGEKLKSENPQAWQEAHGRLYEYCKKLPEKELPDTLEEMEPLFAAVRHGCLAGRYQKALDDVYYLRIQRDGVTNYCCRILGAFGADLACLSHFFESPWDRPASDLSKEAKTVILSWAGFRLRALGRLRDAIQPMKTGLEMYIKQINMKYTAMTVGNLSELFLTLGDVKEGITYAEQSVEFADKSGDDFEMESDRTTLADAFHQGGRSKDAKSFFTEAEEMQKKRQPENPYLYSLRGFRYCDLLISLRMVQDVLERTKETIKIAERNHWLMNIALDNLSIGKALLLQSIHNKSGDFFKAEEFLNRAVDGLREAGTQDYLPRGLFARTTLYRLKKDFDLSWTDLDEAREIAEYGEMRLHLADYHLEACRNIKDQLAVGCYEIIENGETLRLSKEEMEVKFREHLQEVERLVAETGYHRRDGELKELKA
jgi:tetratricopeptide (TPR) repeat protein